jgi:hypothetical protein
MNPEQPDKKKTVKLKVDRQVNFKLVGISSHENDYRLVWSINEHMNIQLVRIDNLVVHQVKLGLDLEFGRYRFYDEDRYVKLYLVSNRCPDGFLFPEIKNLDFVLQIVGEIQDAALKEMIKKLRTVPVISTALILSPEKIKGIRNILVED